MSRLNPQLSPKRMKFAKEKIERLGFEMQVYDEHIEFEFKGEKVIFYPYTGWATGKSIKDGRGIDTLLNQIK